MEPEPLLCAALHISTQNCSLALRCTAMLLLIDTPVDMAPAHVRLELLEAGMTVKGLLAHLH